MKRRSSKRGVIEETILGDETGSKEKNSTKFYYYLISMYKFIQIPINVFIAVAYH